METVLMSNSERKRLAEMQQLVSDKLSCRCRKCEALSFPSELVSVEAQLLAKTRHDLTNATRAYATNKWNLVRRRNITQPEVVFNHRTYLATTPKPPSLKRESSILGAQEL